MLGGKDETRVPWLGTKQGFTGGADQWVASSLPSEEIARQEKIINNFRADLQPLWNELRSISFVFTDHNYRLRGIEYRGEWTTSQYVVEHYIALLNLTKRIDDLSKELEKIKTKYPEPADLRLSPPHLLGYQQLKQEVKNMIDNVLKLRNDWMEIKSKTEESAIIPMAQRGLAANRQQTGEDSNLYSGPAQSGEED